MEKVAIRVEKPEPRTKLKTVFGVSVAAVLAGFVGVTGLVFLLVFCFLAGRFSSISLEFLLLFFLLLFFEAFEEVAFSTNFFVLAVLAFF